MLLNKKNFNLIIVLILMTVAIQGIAFYQKGERRALLNSNAASSEKLTWAPPVLVNPETKILGTGYTALTLDNSKDYIIQLPPSKVNGNIRLDGGHNIVIKGGYVSVPTNATSVQQHAFRLAGQTGTVHIEGVLIDGSNGGEEDCFYLDTPNAIIQIQNVRCMNIPGTDATNHSDVIQFHGGHKEVRVDRLTGSSYYQGLFIGEHDAPGLFGPITLKNINLEGLGAYHRTMLWMAASTHDYLMNYTVSLQNVWLKPGPSTITTYQGIPGLTMPNTKAPAPYTAVLSNNTLSWPGIPNKIMGVVYGGAPSADFVPAGTVGLQYVSPGYITDVLPTTAAPTVTSLPPTALPTVVPTAIPTIIPSPTPTRIPMPTSTPTAAPIQTAYTFGTTTIGSKTDSGDGNSITCNQYTSKNAGTVTSLSVAVGQVDAVSKNYSLAMYKDVNNLPTSLLGSGTSVLAANSWNTLSVSIPVSANTKYWLCYNSSTTKSAYNNMKYTSSSVKAVYKAQAYGTCPATFGKVGASWRDSYSIYATVR